MLFGVPKFFYAFFFAAFRIFEAQGLLRDGWIKKT